MNYKVEKEFDYEGMKCVVIMTSMGHRCGYVGIPKTHPLHGVHYSHQSNCLKKSDLENEEIGKRGIIPLFCATQDEEYARPDYYFNVHGGITYSGGNDYPIENKEGLWWFGYDCAHAGDAKDINAIEDEEIKKIELRYGVHGVVRTLDYCIDECKSLAEQLNKIS